MVSAVRPPAGGLGVAAHRVVGSTWLLREPGYSSDPDRRIDLWQWRAAAAHAFVSATQRAASAGAGDRARRASPGLQRAAPGAVCESDVGHRAGGIHTQSARS